MYWDDGRADVVALFPDKGTMCEDSEVDREGATWLLMLEYEGNLVWRIGE